MVSGGGTFRTMPHVVLVGGGHTHIQVLRRYAMARPEPGDELELTLVVDSPVAVYSGMVPGFAADHYQAHQLEIDTVPLARRAGARVILAPLSGIDPQAQLLEIEGRAPLRYDLASLDIGSTVAGLNLPGVREHALASRPIARLVERLERLPENPERLTIVGGGAGGIEMAFTLQARFEKRSGTKPAVTVLSASKQILPGYPRRVVKRVERAATRRGIRILTGVRVQEVRAHGVVTDQGFEASDATLWVTGAVAHNNVDLSALPLEARGFVLTEDTLQVPGFPNLFAVGDCAVMKNYPNTPKAGVYAVRQGPPLIDNLNAALYGAPLVPYRPQSDFLTLLNLGDRSAIGAKWGVPFEGRWVMNLKDRIDQRFMERFRVLQAIGEPSDSFPAGMGDSEDDEMLCGGCAAKLSQTSLERALGRLETELPPGVRHEETVLGAREKDDTSAVREASGRWRLANLDGFRAFTNDPFLLGQVATHNALSDLDAKGARPRHAQVWIGLPEADQDDEARNEELLFQLLSGVRSVLDERGVELLGGHTTTGPEITVGLHAEAYLEPDETPLTLGGMNVGDELVLTKPLGTGVLLHADAKGECPGRALCSVLESMTTGNGAAGQIARTHEASAATDITGFGLLGHLAEMARASKTSVRVRAGDVPGLPGARDALARGLRSTSHERNVRALRNARIDRGVTLVDKALLCDPQTAGGLLITIPPAQAAALLKALQSEGLPQRQTHW